MKRDLKAMAGETFDLLIVGGGVTGASIAWDASLRGLSVALVERHDFGHATTAASSKLIHGGLRYLQNFELGLVRESLRERRLWLQNAPHMVYPLTFVLPTKGLGLRGRTLLNIGLTLYDWLAFDRNRLDDPDQHIPAHQNLSREEAVALEPGLESTGLTGAMMYTDCQMHYPERLNLELLLGAAEHGAQMANHAEVTDFLKQGEPTGGAADGSEGGSASGRAPRILGVRVRDTISGETHEIRGRVVVNASGPWADVMMGKITGHGSPRRLIRSKGIHLITHNLTRGHAIAAAAPGGGHFFILPWRGHSILGTTDTIYEGDPDSFGVTETDIREFLDLVNTGYPAANLKRDDVLHFYGGMRPLVDRQTKVDVGAEAGDEKNAESYTASRAAEVYDHEAEGGSPGAISSIGGKWTTSRHLAEQVIDLVFEKLARPKVDATTENRPTYGGDVGRYADFERAAINNRGSLTEAQALNLARNYGSRMTDVTRLAGQSAEFAESICDSRPTIAAEVVHGARAEMAMTLEDVLFRRTGIGTLGNPGEAALNKVARLMAAELDWDEAEERRQIDFALKKFQPLDAQTVEVA